MSENDRMELVAVTQSENGEVKITIYEPYASKLRRLAAKEGTSVTQLLLKHIMGKIETA